MNKKLIALNGSCLILAMAFSARAESLPARKNVKRLSATEKTNFVQCVLWLKKNPSAYDPYFWLHHANRDRIWAGRQDTHGI